MEEKDMLRIFRGPLSIHVKISIASITLLICLMSTRQAQADEFAYMITGPTPAFGYIDLDTGVFTQIGNLTVELCALAVHKGKLYGYAPCGTGGTLYEVNPANGKVRKIGTAPFAYIGMGSTAAGLYAFDQSMNLYSVDPATGAAKLIGSTGLSNPGGIGVSDSLGELYIGVGNPPYDCPTFYKVDTKNGTATEVGCMTGTSTAGGGFAFQDGILFQCANFPSAIYKINPRTGKATFVADVQGGTENLYGLAPAAEVEP
jgi:hypothetical protein